MDALHAEVLVASVSDQLDIVPSRDVYLGREFSVADMLDYWETWLQPRWPAEKNAPSLVAPSLVPSAR